MTKRLLYISILFLVFSTGALAQDIVVGSISQTPATCNGYTNGTVTVEVTGGNGDLNYSLSDGFFIIASSGLTPDRTYTFLGVAPGSYFVLIGDLDGLTGNGIGTVVVGEPAPIQIQSVLTGDLSCSYINDGTITVSATGEGGNLNYNLAGPQGGDNTDGIFTGLQAGNYTVTVTDLDGCPSIDDVNNLILDVPTAITIDNITVTDVTCFEGNDGAIAIEPNGGTPSGAGTGYTYNWIGPGTYTSTDEDINTLESGNYSVTVIDGSGCFETSAPIFVDQGSEIIASLNTFSNVSCNGGADGSVNILVSGGTPPYTFSWTGQNTLENRTTRNPNDLLADVYDLTVTDGLGCSNVFPSIVEITEPEPINYSIEDISHVSCFNGSDGSADITITGGTAPYTFTWTGSLTYTSAQYDPTNMPADTYSLQVEDDNGCMMLFPNIIEITQPEDITAVITGSTDVNCFGGNDGQAQLIVDKGTPGYTYLWTGDLSSHTSTMDNPTDLIADTYDLEIRDANACTKVFNDIVTIGQPLDINAVITVTDVLCNGASTGEINIEPSGGTAGYTFDWSGPSAFNSSLEDIANLEAGSYDLSITDAHGCIKPFNNNVVDENTSITASFSLINLKCNGSADGEINATISGGVPPYAFDWSADNGYSNTTDEDISGLDAGNYILTVTDAVGCIESFATQAVTEPDPLTASFSSTNSNCFASDDGTINITVSGGTPNYNYAWTGPGTFSENTEDVSGLSPGLYSVTVSDANACIIDYTDIVTITEPADITASSSFTDITCNGADNGTISVSIAGGTPIYNYAWSGPNGFSSNSQNIASLGPGAYSLTVTDDNTCIKNFPNIESITEPAVIDVTFTGQSNLLCFGGSTGSIDIDISGGVAPYTFSWTNSSAVEVSSDEDPTGLSAGSYSLLVTDASLCTAFYPDAVELLQPTELLTNLSKTDIICYNQSNGTITATTSGGTAPYEYSFFSGGPFTSSAVFTNLDDGTYTVYTMDANGCMTNASITLNEPEQIKIIDYGVSGENLCFGDSSATISINTVTGGVTPYLYSINGGATYQASGVFPDLPGGDYPIVVRDANMCEKAISPLTVDEPFEIKITFYDQDNINSCFVANEGRIAIQANGGSGIIQYALDGGTPQASGEFLMVSQGFHDVRISDVNACIKDTTVEILSPAEIVFDKEDITDVTGCAGDSNGELDLNASGGTGTINYSIDAVNFQASGLFAGLAAGDYTVTARDDNNCTLNTLLSISEPDPISIDSESATPASCNGKSDGSVSVNVSGGTTPYTFSLVPALLPDQASETFSGLPAGDYTISVTDAGACGPVSSGTITITEPSALVLDSVSTAYISCNSSNDAKISIYVSGGSAPYEYSIDNEATYLSTSQFTGLGPDTYTVYARDINGCQLYIDSYVFTEPLPINITATITDVSPCSGGTNGAISATATGGWDSFLYSIDGLNFQATGDFTDLSAGDYAIFTRDTGNCTSTLENVIVTEPEEVSASIAKTDYVDEVLGTITISDASGGTGPYEYSIDGLGGTFTSTTSYTDLSAGSYDVVVRDALGCTFELTVQIFDIIPLGMLINSTNVSCFGANDGSIEFLPQDGVGLVQYSIDDGASFVTTALFENLIGDTTYTLRAYDEEGKQYLGTIYIDEPLELFFYQAIVPANCNAFSPTGSIDLTLSGGTGAYSVTWSNGDTSQDLNNSVSGWYTVDVVDEAGCIVSDSFYIPALVVVTADAGEDTTICAGTSLLLDAIPNAIMQWDPPTYLSNQSIANPIASNIHDSITYTYTVTETSSPYGCYNIDTLKINTLPLSGLSVTPDTFAISGQIIQLEAYGGPFESYSWIPESGLDNSTIYNPQFTAENIITYRILATNAYGCIETDSVVIEVIEDLTVYNVFTPNSDFTNDWFEIENADRFPDILVEVFNRWGSLVFSTVGYSDDKRWDGTSNGKDVPIGTYYYVIVPYPDAKPITGNVTIIR